jgi:hypothetical protein
VARLTPPVKETKEMNLKEVLSSFLQIRETISGKVNIRELIKEGRRF